MRSYGRPVLAGVLAATLTWLGWTAAAHVWQDHQNLHVLIQLEAARQQSAAAAGRPPSP